MALLAPQASAVTGLNVTMSAASGGGDTIVGGSTTALIVRNGDASSKTVTIVRPGTTYGTADPDIALVVPAGGLAIFGPIPSEFADPTDPAGGVDVTYSAVTSVTVAAVRFL
jgi:hypothetical protein